MSIRTLWGYTITDADELPGIITADEFNAFTANKYSGDIRIASGIKAASQAARNYCGWHICPPQACEVVATVEALSIIRNGADLLIQLPARYVSDVLEVMFKAVQTDGSWTGETYDFNYDTNGLLRVYDVPRYDRKVKVRIAYTAGAPAGVTDSLKELVAQRLTHALASSNGVTSESAGGMSITYNSSWVSNSSASSLADDNKETLQPYRLQGVF